MIVLHAFLLAFLFATGLEVLDRSGWLERWGDQIDGLIDRIAARIAPKDEA